MRPSHNKSWVYLLRRRRSYYNLALSALVLAATCLLPYGASASRQPTGAGSVPQSPLVTGADYTLKGSQFQTGPSDAKEKSLKGDLMLPPGTREATYTSDTTKAPISFTDVAPHWRVTTPEGTSIDVELRTSPDGQVWGAWLATDLEELEMPQDSGAEQFGGVIPVGQNERTHRYVQSRLTLRTTNPALTPVFKELTYTFINSGVTPKPPKPQAMAQGTPSDIPKPLMVSRKEWGSPQGQSSPKWTPKYKRVTHVIIHHTATPNNDTDFPARVRAIWYFHTYTRGWGDIGYNYVIDPNGVIYEGRAGGDDVEAGHAYPFNNGSMGVGMLGNFMTAAPTTSAQSALIDLISWKVNQRGIDPQGTASFTGYTNCGGKITYTRPTIAGHRDYRGEACGKPFNATTCPGDRLWSMLPQIRSSIIAEQPPLRAAFTQHDTPGNISPGATVDVHLSMRNSGSLTWPASGQGAVMLGYQWYTPDGKLVKTGWKDIKTPLTRNVPFADTITVTAQLNAPTNIGHYTVVWDMFRDGQGWFNDQGSLPLRVDVVVGKGGTDKLAPKSTVLPLPIYSNSPEIVVRWAGEDEPKGSGIVSYDVQSRIVPNGAWTDWQSATAQVQATFDGEDGYTYEFRSRARDAAGNVEEWPEKGGAYTTVDTRPPSLDIFTPVNGAHVMPGPLVITGTTEPGTFVAVNDKRAEEVNGVFTSTVTAAGRDFLVHVTAADPAGNVSRIEVTVQAAPRYNDVPMTHPAFTAVEYLSDRNIIAGYSDGSFRPDAPLTRAQLAKILAATFQWGLIKPLESRFTDVATDSWMFPYVETAVARVAMEGYDDGTFRPNTTVPWSAVVRSLAQVEHWDRTTFRAWLFLDAPAGHWSAKYMASVSKLATVNEDGFFSPNYQANRAQIGQMIYTVIMHKAEEAEPPDRDDDHNGQE